LGGFNPPPPRGWGGGGPGGGGVGGGGGGGGGGATPPPPRNSEALAKAEPNSQFRGIYIRNNLIRIWVSFICKLSGTPD
jgi:hypothetical protein